MSQALSSVRSAAAELLGRYVTLDEEGKRTFINALRPRREEYDLVFKPNVAEQAYRAYDPIWESPPLWPLRRNQSELVVWAASIPDLEIGANDAAEFPGGYAQLLTYYRPEVTLICWEFMEPGATTGVAFDGLVPLAARWVWFPKPWLRLPAAPSSVSSPWAG